MAAERLSRVPRVSTKSLETKGIIPLPNMPTNSPKPIYDEERHRFFEHSIRRHVKTLTELTTQK
jgi:hypothetical protein